MKESQCVVFTRCGNAERSFCPKINGVDWFALTHDFADRRPSISTEYVTKPAQSPLSDYT